MNLKPLPNLRILVVTPYFAAHGGGIESVAWQLIRHLSALENAPQIRWISSDCDAPPTASPRVRFLLARCWNGIEQRTGLPVPLWSLGAIARLWRAIARADAVHFHDVAYLPSILSALFCLWQRKPYFVTQHTGFVPHPNRWMRALRDWINRAPGRWILNRAAAVVFISDEVRRAFEPLLPGQNLHLVHNGVDTAIFRAAAPGKRAMLRRDLCDELGFDPARPLLIFVGRFVAMKGVLLVAELSRRFPDCNWIFAGRGPLLLADEIGPNARIVSNRRGATLAEVYQAADGLLLPSYSEGFPLVVQEALACGTPVLVETAIGEAAPATKSQMNFERLDRSERDLRRWEAATRRFISDFPESDESRQKRAAFAAAQWNWARCARDYAAIFETVSTGATGGPS